MEPEATYQQEAEQDVREGDLGWIRKWLADPGNIYGCTLTPDEARLVAGALATAERERDEAREQLSKLYRALVGGAKP